MRFLPPCLILLGALALPGGTTHADPLAEFAPEANTTWQHPLFTISYPWHWHRADGIRPPVVLEAAHEQVPQLRVMVLDEPWWLPQAFAVRAAATQLSEHAEVVETGSIDLPDGSTAATGLVRWQMHIGLGIPLQTWFVSTFHQDKWLLATVTVPDHGQAFPDDLANIANNMTPTEAD